MDDELATIEMTRRKEVGFDEGQDAWDAKLFRKRDSEPCVGGARRFRDALSLSLFVFIAHIARGVSHTLSPLRFVTPVERRGVPPFLVRVVIDGPEEWLLAARAPRVRRVLRLLR